MKPTGRTELAALASQYWGGLMHMHTRRSNFVGHWESDQRVASWLRGLKSAGLVGRPESPFSFIIITEHTSNPARPRRLRSGGWRAARLERRVWAENRQGVSVLYGFEASLLGDGQLDLTSRLAQAAAVVIASRHTSPLAAGDARAVMQQWQAACENPAVDILGHPARGIEGLAGMDWPMVFAYAAATGTAVEVNFNTYPLPHREPARDRFWAQWLRWLAESGAWVTIGSDLHNALQLGRLRHDWQTAGSDGPNRTLAALRAMAAAGIRPERVVNAHWTSFRSWRGQSKLERRK